MMAYTFADLKGLRVFLLDDDDGLARLIEKELADKGLHVKRANSLGQARAYFPRFAADLAISDINLPDGNGLDMVKEWRKSHPEMPVIFITAHGQIDSAITALRLGAYDYLQKPFATEDLLAAILRAAEVGHLRRRIQQLESKEKPLEPFQIIGDSRPMERLRNTLRRVAESRADTVLILGESGSGKELAARALHEWSPRAAEPFVEVNCASIPETLLESELFGHEKGAFTDARDRKPGLFELARSGTVFLDEIGEMPIKLQAKLLRVIEYKRFKRLGGTRDLEFNGRIVAATNRRLEEEITEGRFREDLFYRLDVIPIVIPPLRDRKDDIPGLATYLLKNLAEKLEMPCPRLSAGARDELLRQRWHGNVRELKNVLQRTMILHQPKEIEADMLEIRNRESIRSDNDAANSVASPLPQAQQVQTQPQSLSQFVLPKEGVNLEDLERSILEQAMESARFNQTKAAQLLGITRHTLRYRLEKFGLLELHSKVSVNQEGDA